MATNESRLVKSSDDLDYLSHIEDCIYEMGVYTDVSREAVMLLLACVKKIQLNKGHWSEGELDNGHK